MNKTIPALLLAIAACLLPPVAEAQSPCPPLPEQGPLHWQASAGGAVCRAIDKEGRQVFGLMFTDEPLRLPRSLREEEGLIGAHEVHWYRPEVIGDNTGGERRVTTLKLEDGNYAQIWIDAGDAGQLAQALRLAQTIAL